jgi:hypothetical protein
MWEAAHIQAVTLVTPRKWFDHKALRGVLSKLKA